MQTEAGMYAQGFGLQENATMGRGREFNDNLLTTAFKRIAGSGVQMNQELGSKVINSGMQFSGVGQSKVPNAVSSQIFGQSIDAMNQVHQQDEQFRLDSASRWIDILKHEDNYELQQKQIEMQEGDFLDVLGRFGSVISAVAAI